MTTLTLFDLDGTLVDSAPGIHASIRVAAAELGLPEPTAEQLTAMVGPPLQDGFADVLGVEDVDRAVAAYRAHYAAGAMFEATVYPGVAELLADLRAEGQLLAVATSKPVEFARRILDHVGLADAFDSVHGASMDAACGTSSRWSAWRWPRTPTARRRCWSATARRTSSGPACTVCPASAPGGGRPARGSWRRRGRPPSSPSRPTCRRP